MTELRFHTDFLPLADTLYRIAFFILEDTADAEDAVQQTFLKLWEKREGLVDVREPKAYCIRMLKNLCMDRIRARQHLMFPDRLPEQEAPARQDDELDERERLDKVLEAVKALPDRQREVLLLRTVDGLSYEQIAQRTGLSQLSLRVMLSRARSTIKKLR